jgi:hypothetical protein
MAENSSLDIGICQQKLAIKLSIKIINTTHESSRRYSRVGWAIKQHDKAH